MPSLFQFTFRLTPWEYCLHLNFHDQKLAPGFRAVCVRDYLGIFWVGEPEHNEAARGSAHSLARSLVHAHAYWSFPDGALLNVEPVTWLEIRGSGAKDAVYGYMHPTLESVPLDPAHPDNPPLIRAAALATAVLARGSFSMQLALADFRAARREPWPYFAFYAYRVLEDVGFLFGATTDGHPDWPAMNCAFGTTKEKWQPLTDAGTAARHLSEGKLAELAGANRRELLALSYEALTLALAHFGISPGPPPAP